MASATSRRAALKTITARVATLSDLFLSTPSRAAGAPILLGVPTA